MKLYWMSEDSILKQINQEYLIGWDAIETIREQKRQDLKPSLTLQEMRTKYKYEQSFRHSEWRWVFAIQIALK